MTNGSVCVLYLMSVSLNVALLVAMEKIGPTVGLIGFVVVGFGPAMIDAVRNGNR